MCWLVLLPVTLRINDGGAFSDTSRFIHCYVSNFLRYWISAYWRQWVSSVALCRSQRSENVNVHQTEFGIQFK